MQKKKKKIKNHTSTGNGGTRILAKKVKEWFPMIIEQKQITLDWL